MWCVGGRERREDGLSGRCCVLCVCSLPGLSLSLPLLPHSHIIKLTDRTHAWLWGCPAGRRGTKTVWGCKREEREETGTKREFFSFFSIEQGSELRPGAVAPAFATTPCLLGGSLICSVPAHRRHVLAVPGRDGRCSRRWRRVSGRGRGRHLCRWRSRACVRACVCWAWVDVLSACRVREWGCGAARRRGRRFNGRVQTNRGRVSHSQNGRRAHAVTHARPLNSPPPAHPRSPLPSVPPSLAVRSQPPISVRTAVISARYFLPSFINNHATPPPAIGAPGLGAARPRALHPPRCLGHRVSYPEADPTHHGQRLHGQGAENGW